MGSLPKRQAQRGQPRPIDFQQSGARLGHRPLSPDQSRTGLPGQEKSNMSAKRNEQRAVQKTWMHGGQSYMGTEQVCASVALLVQATKLDHLCRLESDFIRFI